jgi:transposase-like protein
MAELSYRRHRFPPIVIQHAVWLYLRFTLAAMVCQTLDEFTAKSTWYEMLAAA